ncbi:hypothetical protein N7532_003593 [Penicillium argentinense]|uniref:F-box domain-containing protein n=1 Tax=Penicillium argentinense TaxID=1131581 RepID=A0A9W9KE56_9EURO|nr:uncharacterized protein N7532_003593 [Penicillium argentinense]KAJ5103064.1 hypothetical protein N7532_003593 [Penicillium argentinense]
MDAPEPAVLLDLPIEILFMVTDYLSPVDIACLALCSRGVKSIFTSWDGRLLGDMPFLRDLGDTSGERSTLLTRFIHDNPNFYICARCLRLHNWRKFPPPSRFVPPACFPEFKDLAVHGNCAKLREKQFPIGLPFYAGIEYELHFPHVQLAMKRFYHGKEHGIHTDSLCFTEATISRDPVKRDILYGFMPHQESVKRTYLTSVDARFRTRPPSLCIRIQSLVMINSQDVAVFPELKHTMCAHFTYICSGKHGILSVYPDARSFLKGYSMADNHGQCLQCGIEWDLEIRMIGTKHLAVVVTRWLDLGPGIPINGRKWNDYYWVYNYRLIHSLIPMREMWNNPFDNVRLPRASFESGVVDAHSKNNLSHEELCIRNLSLLDGERFRDVLELSASGQGNLWAIGSVSGISPHTS